MKILATSPQQILEKFCTFYSNRDLASILKLFTNDATIWGTGIDEYRVGLKEIEEQFKRDWSQSDSGKIVISSHMHSSKDAKTWGSVICKASVTIDGIVHQLENLRGTIILEEDEDGEMKIVHLHTSIPDERQAVGSSFR
ncbi:MAG UNVERIFIED_CONTAM: nuclear transport factor 2 family protein [Rickettsiaceae bacterium]|jgi:ketosteroid isomerase-like protein